MCYILPPFSTEAGEVHVVWRVLKMLGASPVLVASVPPLDQELLHDFVTDLAASALEDGFCLELRSGVVTGPEVWCRQGWRRLSWRGCAGGS